MYGQELRHTKLSNWKGRLVFAILGEAYPGHLIRFFINRRYLGKYTNKSCLKILEMGSNNGAFAFWLSRNPDYMVVGLEYNKTLAIDCQQICAKINRSNLFFICADASAVFPLKIKFDIIFSTHVLEHIPNDRAVLLNAFSNLKPGGLLILQVPFGDPEKQPSKEEDVRNNHVREGYTDVDIREKLEYAGFEIISSTGSVGRIGSFAYQLARRLEKVKIIVNLYILFFPIVLILIYLEQVGAFIRSQAPPFEHWPLVLARRPSG